MPQGTEKVMLACIAILWRPPSKISTLKPQKIEHRNVHISMFGFMRFYCICHTRILGTLMSPDVIICSQCIASVHAERMYMIRVQ